MEEQGDNSGTRNGKSTARAAVLGGLAGAAIALLVAFIAVCGIADRCEKCERDSPYVTATSGDSSGEGIENVDPLVRQFAPVVWVHRREAYGPSSADDFLSRSELTWRTEGRFRRDKDLTGRGGIEPHRLGLECVRQTAACYRYEAHLATDFTRPHDNRPARPPGLNVEEGFYIDPDDQARKGEVGVDPKAPMYYEISRGETKTRITYWFFYGFSVPYKPAGPVNLARLFSHEGDWENVDVVLEADGTPRSVAYYGHGHPRPIAWTDVCKVLEEGEDCESAEPGRPVVYSARFSHASYPTPAEGQTELTKVCADNRFHRPCSYDVRNKGFVWDPLAAGGGGLRDAQAEPWYGFAGAWGSAGSRGDTTGPLGPSAFKLSSEPEPGELKAVTPPPPASG